MALGTKTLTTTTNTIILVADANRDHVLLQAQSDHNTYLGFGQDAANGQGICLLEPGATVEVYGPKARCVINGYSAGEAVIGFETMIGIRYRSGQFAGPWPV